MEIVGYFLAIIIGLSLGLIGSGGSILTVPLLVFLFKMDVLIATEYSLFIVGITSLVGSLEYFRQRLVHLKTALLFGIPSVTAVWITRAYLLPAIPAQIGTVGNWVVTKNIAILLLFALLMIAASYNMIKKEKHRISLPENIRTLNYPLLFLEGIAVGTLTGLVGAGGGFLIIPALVVLTKLPMKMAVGTSLFIVAANSLIGFGSESSLPIINWWFLWKISGFAITGIFIGTTLSKKIDGNKLKPAFGWFILLMGIYIMIKEIFFT